MLFRRNGDPKTNSTHRTDFIGGMESNATQSECGFGASRLFERCQMARRLRLSLLTHRYIHHLTQMNFFFFQDALRWHASVLTFLFLIFLPVSLLLLSNENSLLILCSSIINAIQITQFYYSESLHRLGGKFITPHLSLSFFFLLLP